MPNLMQTFESLSHHHQKVASAMYAAARAVMADHGFRPPNDDHAARLEEACAKYLQARLTKEAEGARAGM